MNTEQHLDELFADSLSNKEIFESLQSKENNELKQEPVDNMPSEQDFLNLYSNTENSYCQHCEITPLKNDKLISKPESCFVIHPKYYSEVTKIFMDYSAALKYTKFLNDVDGEEAYFIKEYMFYDDLLPNNMVVASYFTVAIDSTLSADIIQDELDKLKNNSETRTRRLQQADSFVESFHGYITSYSKNSLEEAKELAWQAYCDSKKVIDL